MIKIHVGKYLGSQPVEMKAAADDILCFLCLSTQCLSSAKVSCVLSHIIAHFLFYISTFRQQQTIAFITVKVQHNKV